MLTKAGKDVPRPGDGVTGKSAPQNSNTSNGNPAFPVAELNTAIQTGPAYDMTPRAVLLRLRMRFPNLQIIPVPNIVRSVKLAANVAKNLDLPSGTVAILLFTNAPVWVNFSSAAVIPTVDTDAGSLLVPQNFPYMLYVQGKQQLSALAEQAGVLQAFCYLDIPPGDCS